MGINMRALVGVSLAIAFLVPSVTWAQAELPPECADVKEGDKPQLEQERVSLSGEVTKVLSEAGADPKSPQLRQKQERLLEVIFKLDCIRPDVQFDALFTTRSAATARNVLVPVFYATNRSKEVLTPNRLVFGGDDGKEVTWGRAVVSVPTDRQLGDLTLPNFWKFELKPDLSKHFVLTSVTSLGTKDSFSQAVLADLNSATSKSLLLFVHGYRVTFDEAAMRSAQLSYDLQFRGVTMFYSWPSKGDLKSYWHDEESVQLAEQWYSSLLDAIGPLPFDSIYVLAHSMGNRLVTTVHNERAAKGSNHKALKEILLAAPDINAEIFNQKIAPVLAGTNQPRTTIYASSGDVALMASKAIHRFKRLGDAAPPVYRRTPFETIDASNAAPLRRAAGHSYVFDSPKVIVDLQRLLIQRQPAEKRPTLQKVDAEPPQYWTFK